MRVFINGKLRYLWYRCYNSWFTSKLFEFGLDVSECSRNTESTRKNPVGSIEHLSLSSSDLSELVCNWDILESLGLIYLSSVVLDSVKLGLFIWTVILRQIIDSHATFRGHDSSAITDIGHVTFSFDREDNYSARPWLVKPGALVSNFQEPFFGNLATVFECFYRVSWETWLSYNDLVEMILEVVSTHAASMTIINGEKWAFWPGSWIFAFGPSHVQNNWNSVFIIISLNALMSIRRIACDETMTLWGVLGIFKIFERIIGWWLVTKQRRSGNKPFNLRLNNIEPRVDSSLFQHGLKLSFTLNLLNNLIILSMLIGKWILQCFLLWLFCFNLIFSLFTWLLCSLLVIVVGFTYDSCLASAWHNIKIIVKVIPSLSGARATTVLIMWTGSLGVQTLRIPLSRRFLPFGLINSVLKSVLIFRLGTAFSVWLEKCLFGRRKTYKYCTCFSISRLLIRGWIRVCEIISFEFGLLVRV